MSEAESKMFQAEKTAYANAPRQEEWWFVSGTNRNPIWLEKVTRFRRSLAKRVATEESR